MRVRVRVGFMSTFCPWPKPNLSLSLSLSLTPPKTLTPTLTLTLALALTLSPSFSATSSSCGAISWHGPHHTAKTSRMIGVEQSWISFSNSAVFTWRTSERR